MNILSIVSCYHLSHCPKDVTILLTAVHYTLVSKIFRSKKQNKTKKQHISSRVSKIVFAIDTVITGVLLLKYVHFYAFYLIALGSLIHLFHFLIQPRYIF